MNIADTLKDVAQRQGEKTGIIEARTGFSMTFAELEQTTRQYCAYLQGEGIAEGDRVMLMVRPSTDFISLTFALFHLGAAVILIDPGMGYKNLLRCIAQVRPDYLIGIAPVLLISKLFPRPFKTVKKRLCCGSFFGLGYLDMRKRIGGKTTSVSGFKPKPHSLAAIIFTTGSTGPPKGVRYEHSMFAAQLRLIREYYEIGPGDVDQPGFPLFALFSTALGACAVIPDMDPTRPAKVDPEKFVTSIRRYGVTYSFGSPAIWRVVSRYCSANRVSCNSLKKVLMAGAPVNGDLVARVFEMMAPDGKIFTPYGATESLPIVSIEGKEILQDTWKETIAGRGSCVGRPLPGISVRVIESSDHGFSSIDECQTLPPRNIGEIIVAGDVVTEAYENNEPETLFSKIKDNGQVWHRLGDVGYFDDKGRLWFCGRKAHSVRAKDRILYTIPCEAIANQHEDVMRSALVGIDTEDGFEEPVLILELERNCTRPRQNVVEEVRQLTKVNPLTHDIRIFLVHPAFPVDIRHNAKIFREQLKVWAQKKYKKNS